MPRATASAWAPLRQPLFRSLWTAAIISYVGTWMQNVGTGWLMASLTTSPMMVGLVQAATTLPVFLVILPAGALADVVDRRRFLLITQGWMVLSAAVLGVLTIFGIINPAILIGLTFVLGLGAVMNDPAWQAITADVVPRPQLEQAIALNSAGFNAARALGPALGGVVIAAAGSGIAFLLNAVSFFGVILFLYRWKRAPRSEPNPAQRMHEALIAGFRYVRTAPRAKAVLVRTCVFSLSASVIWSLLPLIARNRGAMGYGSLLGCFGLGALCGATLLPALRRLLNLDSLVGLATFVFALVTFLIGRTGGFASMCGLLFVAGACWIAILTTFNVSAQTMCPEPIRARALSMYILALQGGMAAGSALWGAVATRVGLPSAFLLAATGLLAGLTAAFRYRLHPPEAESAG
ncbi:MAG: MFS transporter [Acidobacteria bacterium]|nr:MFS transporter [Acidobacteriota bacterium]